MRALGKTGVLAAVLLVATSGLALAAGDDFSGIWAFQGNESGGYIEINQDGDNFQVAMHRPNTGSRSFRFTANGQDQQVGSNRVVNASWLGSDLSLNSWLEGNSPIPRRVEATVSRVDANTLSVQLTRHARPNQARTLILEQQ